MSTPTTHVVRPAGAGHETLYVLLLCLMILAVAGSGRADDVGGWGAHGASMSAWSISTT